MFELVGKCLITLVLSMSLYFSLALSHARADGCTLEHMDANMAAEPVLTPSASERFRLEAKDPTKFITFSKAIPCMPPDLLKLGFDYKSSFERSPSESTSGTYETGDVFQRGSLLITCFYEFDLSNVGKDAGVTSSRAACHQTVPARYGNAKPKEKP